MYSVSTANSVSTTNFCKVIIVHFSFLLKLTLAILWIEFLNIFLVHGLGSIDHR